MPPVLLCFEDNDHKVRYYACESLFNLVKTSQSDSLEFFNEIFDGLCKLFADPDKDVKRGAVLFDKLMKDIVTEGPEFNVSKFIPMLSDRIHMTKNLPELRRFLVGWVMTLDPVETINMLKYLPDFLDGLFEMLSSDEEDIRRSVDNALAEFLEEIKIAVEDWEQLLKDGSEDAKPPEIEYAALIEILLKNCESTDNFTTLTSLLWIDEFVTIGSDQILPYLPQILGAILLTISKNQKNIVEQSVKVNQNLIKYVNDSTSTIKIKELLDLIMLDGIQSEFVPARITSLNWVLVLHSKDSEELKEHLEQLIPFLLESLSDNAEQVARLDLEVLAKISKDEVYFMQLIEQLLSLLKRKKNLLEKRGTLIIRQLSLYINPVKIYRALAKIIVMEDDHLLTSSLIRVLNLILLSSTELHDLRESLRTLNTEESKELFVELYKAWCHSPSAVYSLCLLSQVYEHSSNLITKFGDLEISLNLLVEIDKLVKLLESPVFLFLRLQLLEPEKYPFLLKSLYGLLMFLPQTTAFDTLRSRLNSVATIGVLRLIPQCEGIHVQPDGIDYDELLTYFVEVQENHVEQRIDGQLQKERNRNKSISLN
eukprot:TRINITY_DN1193_c0_g1_i1.p1 TRINITY_DN1193_c0_g1~~TRINITY_DN1193_c0_g1_i1.p1  ORF type:complete len:595 (+),score=129.00 TRINITY_DN1193_c0_g1_i1:396-2180(+)